MQESVDADDRGGPDGPASELSISKDEFVSRVNKIQEYLQAKGLTGLVVFSTSRSHIWYQTGHVSYLSGWADLDRISDAMVVVPLTGEPVMLLSGLPYMTKRAHETSWLSDIRTVASFDPSAAAPPEQSNTFGQEARAILNKPGQTGKKIAVAGLENMPVPIYKALLNAFSESELAYGDDIVAQLRSVKSPAEVAIMRRAARLSDLGYETLVACARDGMRGYEVVAEMERVVRLQGADYVKYWMCSGPGQGWPVTMPDLRPHPRILHSGDQITSCSYVVFNGYWAHAMRTGFLGDPSPQQQRIFPPCAQAHKTAIELIKPGARIGDVVKAVRAVVEQADMKLHCSRIGHGIGLDYGESPTFNEDNNLVLQPGHVLEIHAQCDMPGTENFYVPLGDVLHVTDKAVESLTKCSQELFHAPG